MTCRWCGRSDAIEVVERQARRVARGGTRRRHDRAEPPSRGTTSRRWSSSRPRCGPGSSRSPPQVLPDVPRLPASLRKVATFAAARRARLGGPGHRSPRSTTTTTSASGSGVQVAPPGPTRGHGTGGRRRAALAGPAGGWRLPPWRRGAGRLGGRSAPTTAAASDRAARLTDQVVGAARAAERDQRVRHRARSTKLKAENADLRRKLGETRAAERAARERADARPRRWPSARARRRGARPRRPRRRSAGWRAQAEELRGRGHRAGGGTRARSATRRRCGPGCCWTRVVEAAAGLRRELALPRASGAPADRVEADAAEEGVADTVRRRRRRAARRCSSSYLALPRAHLIVDGYNVSKTAWPQLVAGGPADPAAHRGWRRWWPARGAEITVVFDAARRRPAAGGHDAARGEGASSAPRA